MSERLQCEVLQKARYTNTLTFTFGWAAQPQSGEAPSGEHLRGEAGIGVIAGNTV